MRGAGTRRRVVCCVIERRTWEGFPASVWRCEMSSLAFDYKLTDLLGSAGAAIGIIIAGTIFRQYLSMKYMELAGRLRELAADYRGRGDQEPRYQPLQCLIRLYGHRLFLLQWASTIGAVALLCLLTAVFTGALSLIAPASRLNKIVGTASLLLGLLLMAVAVGLELLETIGARREINNEVADLDDAARQWCR